MIRLLFIFSFFICSSVLAVEFKGKFIQGHFILGKTEPGSNIYIDKKKVKVSEDGFFAFGIGKDRKFDITITKNVKDTCWKFTIGGDLEMNILAQKISLTNSSISFSITKKDDPNILYKTLRFSFDKLINGKYLVLPFSEKFEFDNEPVSVYTIKKFDSYKYEVIKWNHKF